MLFLKIATAALLLATCSAHDKKIELQDIEEDNLKSEKTNINEYVKSDKPSTSPNSDRDLVPLEFLKNGLLRYFDRPTQPQQPRYVHQYAVNEPPEKTPVSQKPQITAPSGPQQAMVGYYSNVPMQIYLVPQYYGEQEQQLTSQPGVQYAAPTAPARPYTSHEPAQSQANYIEVPAYVMPTGKTYVPQYQPPVTYVTYTQPPTGSASAPAGPMIVNSPTVTPGVSQASLLAYQMPTFQYPTTLVSPPVIPKEYYQTQAHFENTNTVEEPLANEVDSAKNYPTAPQSETSYTKPSQSEFPRYYTSRAPIKEDYRQNQISELPAPNPLALRPHGYYSHLPKALPMYRPLKPVYNPAAYISNAITPRPIDGYPYALKKRPSSLLDSYVPSSVQLEYMKRGYARDPLAAYEALSSGRSLYPAVTPRQLERGFLPNQMYHTAAGGVTFGHYKRTPKAEKVTQS